MVRTQALLFQLFILSNYSDRAFSIQVPVAVLAIISVLFASIILPQLHLQRLRLTLMLTPTKSTFRAILKRADFPGALSLIVAVFSLLLFLDNGANVLWTSTPTITAIVLFLVFLLLVSAMVRCFGHFKEFSLTCSGQVLVPLAP
jgi:hypothetical protein